MRLPQCIIEVISTAIYALCEESFTRLSTLAGRMYENINTHMKDPSGLKTRILLVRNNKGTISPLPPILLTLMPTGMIISAT